MSKNKNKIVICVLLACLIILLIILFLICFKIKKDNGLQIRVNDNYIQWSEDENNWKNGISLEEIKGENGDDASVSTYTITYDYGTSKSLFNNANDSTKIKATEWLTEIPTIKDEYKDIFLGWYIKNTNEQILKYDFIGGDITVSAKFNQADYEKQKVITFDYGQAKSFFNDTQDNVSLKIYENITYLPTIKNEYKDIFLGWYTTETNVRIVKNDFIDDGIILYAKFDVLSDKSISGLYQNGKYVKTWTMLKEEYPTIIKSSEIVSNSFKNYSSEFIDELVIDSSITKMESGALDSNKFISIFIPSSVTNIEERAISCSEKLIKLVVSSANTRYDSRDNCNAIIETNTNKLIVGCEKTIIPDNVKSISGYAFYGCEGLTSITIPKSVESIETRSFALCENLVSIELSNGLKSIGIYAFYKCTGLISIDIPNSVSQINDEAFEQCESLISVVMPNGIKHIGYWLFFKCSSLTNVLIPDSVESIAFGAFGSCDNLSNIFYVGTKTKWDSFANNNSYSSSSLVRYYSETMPEENIGSYWHYIDGKPTVWTNE